MRVEVATQRDLEQILAWLKREHEQDGEGFWCNRSVIARACDDEELFVIREDGEAIAYQVGAYGLDIVNVRKDRRRNGYGTMLIRAALERIRDFGETEISVECAPLTSRTFWAKQGFELLYPDGVLAPCKYMWFTISRSQASNAH